MFLTILHHLSKTTSEQTSKRFWSAPSKLLLLSSIVIVRGPQSAAAAGDHCRRAEWKFGSQFLLMSKSRSCPDTTGWCCFDFHQQSFALCCVPCFSHTVYIRRSDWSCYNEPTELLQQTPQKCVNIKSLVILSFIFLRLLPLIKSLRNSPGSGKLISLNTPHSDSHF